jgi:hypothetical protein
MKRVFFSDPFTGEDTCVGEVVSPEEYDELTVAELLAAISSEGLALVRTSGGLTLTEVDGCYRIVDDEDGSEGA